MPTDETFPRSCWKKKNRWPINIFQRYIKSIQSHPIWFKLVLIMSAPHSCIGDLWCPAQWMEWCEKTSCTCFQTLACESLNRTASEEHTGKAREKLDEATCFNWKNKNNKWGACTYLFKLEVTWQAGCVQQLLDSGHLSHLLLFQEDLESVGTLRCFSSWSKKETI